MVTAMASPFHYQDPFPLGADTTKYRLLTKEHVSVAEFDGKPILKVAPEGLTRVFFSDNGSTAVEVALKIGRASCRERV